MPESLVMQVHTLSKQKSTLVLGGLVLRKLVTWHTKTLCRVATLKTDVQQDARYLGDRNTVAQSAQSYSLPSLFYFKPSSQTQVALSLRNNRVGSARLRELQVPKISPRVQQLATPLGTLRI